MSRLQKNDELLVARYVDGEMPDAARRDFEQRLRSEAALERAVAAAREHSALLRATAERPVAAPAGFASSVLDSVRRMPSREELVRLTEHEASIDETLRFARRILMAAVLLFGFAVLFGLGLFIGADNDKLEAGDLEQRMHELDQRVLEMKTQELGRGTRPR